MRPVLEEGGLDEDDLYAALESLAAQQRAIEEALAPKAARGSFLLYDVSRGPEPRRSRVQWGR